MTAFLIILLVVGFSAWTFVSLAWYLIASSNKYRWTWYNHVFSWPALFFIALFKMISRVADFVSGKRRR